MSSRQVVQRALGRDAIYGVVIHVRAMARETTRLRRCCVAVTSPLRPCCTRDVRIKLHDALNLASLFVVPGPTRSFPPRRGKGYGPTWSCLFRLYIYGLSIEERRVVRHSGRNPLQVSFGTRLGIAMLTCQL